ncbi:MAG: hypothetical protein J6D37_07135 [Clostridia bacterium]|nr:hypothetical protein [Clostridia bacterium]
MPACCVCFRREEGGILNCSGDPKGERLKETDHNKSKGFLFPMLVKPATEQKEQRETKQPKARKDASSRKTNGDKPLKKDMPKAAKKTERKKTEPQKGAKAKKEVLVKSEKIQSSPANEKQKGKRGRGKKENKLKVLFFGGVGEIGKNTTALQYGDEIIVIDAATHTIFNGGNYININAGTIRLNGDVYINGTPLEDLLSSGSSTTE